MKRPSARPRGAAQTTHVARKRFGQHFLIDPQIIHGIVGCIDPQPADRLVEIGPGLGALTWALLERIPRLAAVEIDRDLAARWRQQAPDRVELIEADALAFDFASLGTDLRLVGNLPYNISTPLLFHLMDVAERVRDQHFMLQWRYDMVNLLDVPPESFDPPPKVDSAVVRMTPRPASALDQVDRGTLSALVTAAFSQRRKLLRHSLGSWLDTRGYGGDFDLQRRAEEVGTAEYVALAQSLPQKP